MGKNSSLSLGGCARCPRLFEERQRIKKQFPEYWSEPVGQWGDFKARILVIGLAPGLHGAARTGRAFVGDSSGAFLFSALFRKGLRRYIKWEGKLSKGLIWFPNSLVVVPLVLSFGLCV